MRYCSRQKTTKAKTSKSSISLLAATAFCQKFSCPASISTANKGGRKAARTESSANSPGSRWRWSRVRSCGSNRTERASSPRVRAAQTAANTFKLNGCQTTGSSLTGQVTTKYSGAIGSGRQRSGSGCQSQPVICDTNGRLASVTQ